MRLINVVWHCLVFECFGEAMTVGQDAKNKRQKLAPKAGTCHAMLLVWASE